MPTKCCLKSSEKGSAIESIGMPLVFEAITAPGLRCFSTSANSLCLISRFSTTASMTKSQSLSLTKSSVKFPVEISLALSPSINGAGRSFLAASKSALTIRLRTAGDSSVKPFFSSSAVNSLGAMSNNKVGIPAFERCAAMPAPIVPAPKTAAFVMFIFSSNLTN